MNAAHLHLIMNHLPVLGSMLGAALLAYGLSANSVHTRLAGFYTLLIATIGGIITYLSGEEAEEIIEHTAGVMHDTIEAHEDFAKFALIALALSGLAALAGLVLTKRNSPKARQLTIITLMLALLASGVAGWTGLLGGKIMHPETTDAPLPTNNETETGEHEHEEGHEH